MNEWYARDTSKKIRAVFRAKGLSGESLCVHLPYGYRKDPDNPKRWAVDEEAAEVVRQIFRWCLAGLGTTHIANRLRENRIDTPAHHAQKLGGAQPTRLSDDPYDWGTYAVAAILSRREYLGHTINFKTHCKSYKSKKTVRNDPSDYAVFENTHEAVVDQATFDRVQQLRESGKRRHDSSGRLCIFSGLTYCADCGSRMYLSSGASIKPEQDCFICSGFRSKKVQCNSSHYIRRVVLEQMVLAKIQQVTTFAAQYEREFVELLRQSDAEKSRKELTAGKRKLMQSEKRIQELDNIISRLYEDKVNGVLTNDRFVKLSQGYEQEQADLARETETLAMQISVQEQQTLDVSRFLAQVRKHTHVTELTPTLLNELVERIEVHAPDKSSGKRKQQIDVVFNYVGAVGTLDLPKGEAGAHSGT
jgi:hypothetical protein